MNIFRKIFEKLSIAFLAFCLITTSALAWGGTTGSGSGSGDSWSGIEELWKLVGSVITPSVSTHTITFPAAVFTGILDMNGNKIDLDADADTSITADTDDQIDFEIGGADVMVLDGTGLTLTGLLAAAGISIGGTVNSGDINLYDAVNDGNPALNIGSTSANKGTIQAIYDTGAQTLDYFNFATTSATEGDIIFSPAGLVGIGTTAPAQLIHMVGNGTSAQGWARFGLSTSEYTEIGHRGSNSAINAVGDGNLDFRHDGNTKMTIKDDGKV